MLTTTHNTSILTPFYEWGNISPKSHCKKKITEQDLDLVYLNTQMVNRLPTMQETRVLSLGREVPLEKGMATHSSILAWKIPWTEEPGELQSMTLQRVGYNWVTNTCTFHFKVAHSEQGPREGLWSVSKSPGSRSKEERSWADSCRLKSPMFPAHQ